MKEFDLPYSLGTVVEDVRTKYQYTIINYIYDYLEEGWFIVLDPIESIYGDRTEIEVGRLLEFYEVLYN